MDAVAFTTRQVADFFLLVAALKVEGGAIGARVDLGIAQLDDFRAAGDGLPDSIVITQIVAGLVDVGQINRVAVFNRASVWRFAAGQHFEQRRFTGTVGADHADDTTRGQVEGQVFDQQLVAHGFG